MQYKNGVSRIRTFKNFDVTIDFPRRKQMETIQFTFGGICESEIEESESEFKKLKHGLKQIIYNKHKDGYYKEQYCFIPKINEVYKKKGKGLVYFEIFLYLEESYERDFIVEHLLTLFAEIDALYSKNKFFKFTKYNPTRKTLA